MRTRGTKQSVREYFDREVDGYLRAYTSRDGSARSDIVQERRRLVFECLHEPIIGRVLDIGSGPGVFAAPLLARAREYWVADLSPEMVRRARGDLAGRPGASRVRYQVADVESLPFRDGVFDTVLCVGVLQYLSAPVEALRELSRVTRAGGQVIISFPNRRSPLNVFHRGVVATLRQGRDVLRRVGLELHPPASRLTFRDDIPNASFAATHIRSVARQVGLHAERSLFLSVHFPCAIPGLRVPLRGWNRLANRAFRAGWFPTWGREAILGFYRDASAVSWSPPAR